MADLVKVTARLEQLSCPDCANMIERVVNKQKGVQSAEVRYTTNKLIITFDKSLIGWDDIEKAIGKLGYAVVSKTESA
ncbi:MAG TPA: heavy metal-associated domain-containing protein [Bacillota bacterium]|nr:heavy metal-associated domain-containing protein [Bacillota bacterium]